MQEEAVSRSTPPHFHINTAGEFRAALRRIRSLDPATNNSAAALERAALEIAVARYLAHDDNWTSLAPEREVTAQVASVDRHNSAATGLNI